MCRKNTFPFMPATATSGISVSFTWKLLLVGVLVITGFIGSISGELTHTAKAASKPHASTIQVSDCSNYSGANTLGNAITSYNSGDTIQFACTGGTSQVYTITVPSTISVTKDLTLNGNGYKVALDGGNAIKILNVSSGANLTLNALTIAHGKGINGDVGAISNSGILTITNSTFAYNTAYYSIGDTFGGAIANTGTINSIANSTFAYNSATSPAFGYGGAIYNGGTINSIANTTFAYNTASGGEAGYGAAIANDGGTINSIVNSVFGKSSGNGNCDGTIPDGGGNFSDDASCGFTKSSSHNSVPNFNLGTLGYYVGSTQIVPLLAGNAAIEGDSANCLTFDQRGMPRPGAPSSCDAGAFQSGIIGNGTDPTLCTEPALNGALAAAGYISIDCPPNTTITVTAQPDSTTNYRSITDTVTLDASPSVSFTLSGGNSFQLFQVITNANLSINNLTIADSLAPANNCVSTLSCGGGIFNDGTITVTNSTFISNTANDIGGAIYNDTNATVAGIYNSSFISNTAPNSENGGGIYTDGAIGIISNTNFVSNNGIALFLDANGSVSTLTNSSFLSNAASVTEAFGGAITNFGTISDLTNSTFFSNTANGGGALYNNGNISNISNSLFGYNFASSTGGAISNDVSGVISNIVNTTFVSNTAASVGAIDNGNVVNITNSTFEYNSSPTIFNDDNFGSSTPATTLANNIVAQSTAVQPTPLIQGNISNKTKKKSQHSVVHPKASSTNCDFTTGTYIDAGGNLSDDNTCVNGGAGSHANVTNLNLGTLQNNGGPTETIPLLAGSAALFAGVPASCPATDQRGIARPQPANTNCDSGAFESNLQYTSTITLTNNPNPSLLGQTVTLTATVTGNGVVTPTGSIVFTNTTTNQTLGTANLNANGVATITTTFSSVGFYTITATYTGDGNYGGSSASTTEQVGTLPPTIAVFAGNGQSTPISTTFPVALQAIVRDGATGNPLAGVTVVFQAPTSGASGTFSPTNSTTFTATTNANGVATANAFVANGIVGSYQVTATANGAASPAVFNLVNSPANSASGYTYYLPFLANNANNFTTYLVFQNTANVSSTVTISFYDNNGNAVGAASGTCSSVAALGECIVPNPFASGKQGQGIIVSQQPLNVIVSEATPYGGSAYAVTAGASNSLIAPVAIHNGLVDFTTQLSVFNGGNTTVTGTVQFFDQSGNHVTAADKSFTLAAHSTTIYDQSQDNTLSNFYGWAQISSPAGSQLVAQTLEQRPSVKFVAIVNAQFNPQTTLYAPAIFNGAFGNFVTGANLVNPNSQSVTVTITYYKNDGTASTTAPFVIAANGVVGVYQGGNGGNGLPSGGLPSNWYGAATVKVTGGSGGIIMFVNEQGGLTATGSDQSGTYGAAVSGSSTVGLPVMANGAFGGYITGATIENITSSPVTATVQYYDLSGNAVGTAKTVTIGGNASAALYQGGSDQALSNGFYGTAQVTVTGGSSSSLLVTTNAQSNAFFYSYTEPNF